MVTVILFGSEKSTISVTSMVAASDSETPKTRVFSQPNSEVTVTQ